MEAHGVVPEILPSIPAHVAMVQFPSGFAMGLGNELTPAQVKDTPTVKWPSESGALYSVLFIDPDAPSRTLHSYREVNHWLVINVPGSDITKGDTIFPFIGSGCPEGTGLHRYILVVLKQNGEIPVNSIPNAVLTDRFKFSTKEFITKFNATPIAANFYQAQVDDFIREKRAALLAEGFKTHQIVPDVVDSVPKYAAEVVYPSGTLIMSHGGELTPTVVKDIPAILAWKTEPNSLYTLLFVDPDAPSRVDPNLGQFLHWLVVNIPGTDISKGDTIAEYIGSGPPKDTGLHRYVFLVYKQQGSISLAREKMTNRSVDGRTHFKVKDFAEEYGLGDPVAGSLYQAQYDDYVPVLHAQLGFN